MGRPRTEYRNELKTRVLDALLSAELELTASTGLVVTDRPDLPLSESTSWINDPAETLAKIRQAIKSLSDIGSGA